MKKLDFTGEEADVRFEIVYDGFLTTPRGFSAPSETRVVSKILDKLEALAHADRRGNLSTFSLDEQGGVALLEEEEFNLLKDSLAQVKWTAAGSRKATEVLDWLAAAPPHLEKVSNDAAK